MYIGFTTMSKLHPIVTCYLIGLGTSVNFFMEVFGRDFQCINNSIGYSESIFYILIIKYKKCL